MEINIQPNESFVVICMNGNKEERLIIKANEEGDLIGMKEQKNLGGMVLGKKRE